MFIIIILLLYNFIVVIKSFVMVNNKCEYGESYLAAD